jgi:AraC-like DNA-binding protein/quercetin dioxygenase-like cupin family protein
MLKADISPRTLNISPSPEKPRIWVRRCTGDYQTQPSRPHVHTFFELLFVERGEGWQSINKQKISAKPGTLVSIRPGEVHDPRGLEGTTVWIIAFGADALNSERTDAEAFFLPSDELLSFWFLYSNNLETGYCQIDSVDFPRWLVRLQQLDYELQQKPSNFVEAARSLLRLILIDTARALSPQLKNFSPQSNPLLIKVFHYIENNYLNPIRLEDVAEAVCLSPAYLTDLVRRYTGRSVYKWIVERRMAEARCLLMKTDCSVSEISERLSYSDTSYFIQKFRQFHGTTPQAWRLSRQGGKAV